MQILALALFGAAVAAAPPPPKAPPVPAGSGGPYEPIIVEGVRDTPGADPWTIGPDPARARRYAPRASPPLNRLILRF